MSSIFLFLIARRFSQNDLPCYIAVAYYLFTPFAVIASRSIQPDAVMVAALLVAIWSTLRYYEQPSVGRFLICGFIAACAVFIKPSSTILTIAFIFAFYSLIHFGFSKSLSRPSNYLFILFLMAPCVISFLLSRSDTNLNSIAMGNFIPQWIFTLYFWKGWAVMLARLVSPPTLMFACLGMIGLLKTNYRPLIYGYWAGYFAWSVISTFTTPSHDYWHLQIIPLIALGLSNFTDMILPALEKRFSKPLLYTLALCSSLYILFHEYRQNVFPYYTTENKDFIAFTQEIGDTVEHSAHCVILAYNYGKPECYYGNFAARFWPVTQDFWAQAFQTKLLSAEERYQKYFAPHHPEYFIISRNLSDFNKQPDLKNFLYKNFKLVKETPRLIVFDLRSR